MRATFMYGAGDVRVETVPDPVIRQPTDALVRVAAACVCGSDLHPYHSMPAGGAGRSMGHEFIGVVEETGSQVSTVRRGDLVIAPFAWSDDLATLKALDTGVRGGPDPEDITLDTFGRAIPEA